MSAAVEQDALDPSTLSLSDLRELRHQLQREDDAVSYVRRIAQARLDIVGRYLEHEVSDNGASIDVAGELCDVLVQSLSGGSTRPPRPLGEMELDPLATELDMICADAGFSRIDDLNIEELTTLRNKLTALEREISEDRRRRYERLDVLNAELVRRYREGAQPSAM